MKNNINNLDELTFKRIQNIRLDEPSQEFTQKVMQTILLKNASANSIKNRSYYWMIAIIPTFIFIVLYSIRIFHWTDIMNRLLFSSIKSMEVFLALLNSFLLKIKNIHIHSTIMLSSCAVLFLLLIEEFLRRFKYIMKL